MIKLPSFFKGEPSPEPPDSFIPPDNTEGDSGVTRFEIKSGVVYFAVQEDPDDWLKRYHEVVLRPDQIDLIAQRVVELLKT